MSFLERIWLKKFFPTRVKVDASFMQFPGSDRDFQNVRATSSLPGHGSLWPLCCNFLANDILHVVDSLIPR